MYKPTTKRGPAGGWHPCAVLRDNGSTFETCEPARRWRLAAWWRASTLADELNRKRRTRLRAAAASVEPAR